MSRKPKKGRKWRLWRRRNEPVGHILVEHRDRPNPAFATPRTLARYDAVVEAMSVLRAEVAAVEGLGGVIVHDGYVPRRVRRVINGLYKRLEQLERRRRELGTPRIEKLELHDWVTRPMYSTLAVGG